jgi:hypothetical protein
VHPYRDIPIEPDIEPEDDDTRVAFVVLALVSMIEMFAAPMTVAGCFGAACSIASVGWLARH